MQKTLQAAIALSLALSLLVAGCQKQQPRAEPKLPAGFTDSKVPDTEVLAFAYLRPSSPIFLARLSDTLQVNTMVDAVSAWVQTDGTAAARISLPSPDGRALVARAAESHGDLWVGDTPTGVIVASSTSSQLPALKAAVAADKWTAFTTKYPEAWDTMRWLPSNPASPPLGVAFASVDQRLLPFLKDQGIPEVANLTSGLGAVGVDHLVLGLYADSTFVMNGDLWAKMLRQDSVTMLIVAEPTLPSFMVTPALTTAAGQGNLQKLTLNKQQVFYGTQESFHAFIHYDGKVLYVAVSINKDRAKNLLLSTMSSGKVD